VAFAITQVDPDRVHRGHPILLGYSDHGSPRATRSASSSHQCWRLPDPDGRLNPMKEFFASAFAGCDRQNHALGNINVTLKSMAVEKEHYLDSCVPNSFVAVSERVVANQREAERRGLLFERRIQVAAVEGC
jgi:hypothetical protein